MQTNPVKPRIIETDAGRMVLVEHLIEHAQSTDVRSQSGETMAQMWERKFSELGELFVDSVTSKGITTPVLYDVDADKLRNGHHRVVAAWVLNIEYLPFVRYWDDSEGYDPQSWE